MKINREKSISFKHVISIGLVGLILVNPLIKMSPSIINKVKAASTKPLKTVEEQYDALFEGQKGQEQRDYDYFTNVHNADLSEYDEDFLNFYDNGLIVIEGIEEPIKIKQLIIISKDINGTTESHVVSYKNMTYDIFNNCDITEFDRDYLMDFMNSNCFYNFYLACKENNYIKDNVVYINDENREILSTTINTYDKTMHDKAPQTYYMKHR